MRLKTRLLAAAISFALILPYQALNADVASDVNANLPTNVIFNNAFTDGLTLENIFIQIGATSPGLIPNATSYATCNNLAAAETIMVFAFTAAPQLAQATANAARACNVTEEELLNAALLAGIDPTTIGEATAAGGAGTGSPIAAPSFGSAAGTGGGGVASGG